MGSVFGTVDSHLNRCRLDVSDPGATGSVGMHGHGVLAGPQTADVDIRAHVVGTEPPKHLATSSQPDVDDRRDYLCGQLRAQVAYVARQAPQASFERTRW